MNLILLVEDDFVAAQRVRLVGRRHAYVRDVHRAQVGTALRIGALGGCVGHGTVVALDERELVMDVAFEHDPPPPAPLTVLLALPRPKVLRRVLQCVAAMGIKRVVLFNTWRVEKSFWESPSLADAAIRAELMLGLEQGGDTIMPSVEQRRRFKPFVEDEVPQLIAGTRALVAHPLATASCPAAVSQPLSVAFGPEGGFTPYEIALLCAHGFEPVSLGRRALRVEHAVAAVLGRLWSPGA
jgi:RsmE family RNA methyltransferase